MIFGLSGCFASYNLSEKGNSAELNLRGGSNINAELVIINDSSVIISDATGEIYDNQTYYYILRENLYSLTVEGFSNSGWIAPVLLLQALPALLISITASTYTQRGGPNSLGVFSLLAIPAAVSIIIFSSSDTEDPHWDRTMGDDILEEFKIYTRYPKGLKNTDIELITAGNKIIELPLSLK
jgi:hypothetical protein